MNLGEAPRFPPPDFSIITPAFNAENFLERAVHSVFGQTLESWELIIIDDGSTDATLQIAQRLMDEKATQVRVFSQDNGGSAAARNVGIDHAHGEYLCFLDADDQLFPDYLERQAAFIRENPGYAIYSCNGIIRCPGYDMLWNRNPSSRTSYSTTLDHLLAGNSIFGMAAASRKAVNAVGAFRNTYVEDYDLWLRLLIAGFTHIYHPRILGVYWRHAESKSANRGREWQAASDVLKSIGEDHVLSTQQNKILKNRIARYTDSINRITFELALKDGQQISRFSALRARRAYASGRHWFGAACLMMVAPEVYRRYVMRHQHKHFYRNDPDISSHPKE